MVTWEGRAPVRPIWHDESCHSYDMKQIIRLTHVVIKPIHESISLVYTKVELACRAEAFKAEAGARPSRFRLQICFPNKV